MNSINRLGGAMIRYRKDQKEIMKYTSGTMGIQAVPGAGKTFIITHLVSKLLKRMESKEQDGKILVLTFMNSAANNFKSRIRTILEEEGLKKNNFEVMTIHSLAMKIIKENPSLAGINELSEVIDDYKKSMLIDEAIEEYKQEHDGDKKIKAFLKNTNDKAGMKKWKREFHSIVGNSFKLLKYSDIDDKGLEKVVEQDYKGIMKIISPIYSSYQRRLRYSGYMDYDDLLILAYNILKDNEDVAKKYQEKYRYVFEDECQDSNAIQGKIIDIISKTKKKRNLVRVGDVNQSITGTFTGANPRHFIEFCKNADYSYEMNMAGRSSKQIIDLANELVREINCEENKERAFASSLEELYIEEVEKNQGYKENPKMANYAIVSKVFNDDAKEVEYIARQIRHIKERRPNYSIGILGFSNYEVDSLAENLTAYGIEFEKMGSNTLEQKKLLGDIKRVIDFLRDPGDQELFTDLVLDCFVDRKLELSDDEYNKYSQFLMNQDIEEFVYNTDEIAALKIREYFELNQQDLGSLVESIGLSLDLDEKEKELLNYLVFYIDNLSTFEEGVDLERISNSLDPRYSRNFNAAIEMIYEIGEKEIQPGSVTLATLHKSKGMEWDCVIIRGINNSDFPTTLEAYFRIDRKYLKDAYRYPEANINEEIDRILGGNLKPLDIYKIDLKKDLIAERARLLYVGITRAKRELHISNTRNRLNKVWNKAFFKPNSEFFNSLSEYISEEAKHGI